MKKAEYIYEMTMKVRDYECDLQGIVNNANYQHYMEHTRHEFLESIGLSFADLHNKGIDAVVARVNIRYKVPLRSGDLFKSCLWLEKKGIRWIFHQDLYKASTGELTTAGEVTSVTMVNQVLAQSPELENCLFPYVNKEIDISSNKIVNHG
ncbi:MAG: acyl-CoA thioesterase [Bacteroidaceae bacterium]